MLCLVIFLPFIIISNHLNTRAANIPTAFTKNKGDATCGAITRPKILWDLSRPLILLPENRAVLHVK